MVGETEVDAERGSSYTIDGGLTWIDINNNPDTNYVTGDEIVMRSLMLGFAGGFSVSPSVGGIFRWGLPCWCSIFTDFNTQKSIKVCPNPTTDFVNVYGDTIQKITVVDAFGKLISESNYFAVDKAVINLSTMEKGVYFAQIVDGSSKYSIKVLKI